MQWRLSIVDWKWLTSHGDAAAMVEAIYRAFDMNPPGEDVHVEGTPVDCGESLFMCASEILAAVADPDEPVSAAFEKKNGKAIRALLPMLWPSDDPAIDELGLSEVPDSCLYTSMSPKSVAKVAKACASLDRAAVKKAMTNDDLDLDDFEPEEIASFLDDVLKVVEQAHAKGWGIIGTGG